MNDNFPDLPPDLKRVAPAPSEAPPMSKLPTPVQASDAAVAADEAEAPKRPRRAANGAAKPAKAKAAKAAKTAPKATTKAAKAKPKAAKGKAKTRAKGATRNLDPSKRDQFGFLLGSMKAKAAAMYATKKGATLGEVKEALKSTQFNLLTELEGKGYTINKTQEDGNGPRKVTRYKIVTK